MNILFESLASLSRSSPTRSAGATRADHVLAFDSVLRLSSSMRTSHSGAAADPFELGWGGFRSADRTSRDALDRSPNDPSSIRFAAETASSASSARTPPPADSRAAEDRDRREPSPAGGKSNSSTGPESTSADAVSNGRSDQAASETEPGPESPGRGDGAESASGNPEEPNKPAATALAPNPSPDAEINPPAAANSESLLRVAKDGAGASAHAVSSVELGEDGERGAAVAAELGAVDDEPELAGAASRETQDDPSRTTAMISATERDAAGSEKLASSAGPARSRRAGAAGEGDPREGANDGGEDGKPVPGVPPGETETRTSPPRPAGGIVAAAPEASRDESPKPSTAAARSDAASLSTGPRSRQDTQQPATSSTRAEHDTTNGRGPVGPSDAPRFIHRVSRAVELAHQRGESLQIRLSPPELGSLRVEIAVRGGVLTAHLEADTSAARTALLDNLPILRDRLAEQEIRVDRFEVDVRDDAPGKGRERSSTFEDQRRQAAEWRPNNRPQSALAGEEEQPARIAAPWRHSAGQLNLVV